jgi:mono/diheme cytochrome c family protein
MTGMPAFGENHDDQEIWEIVSFVNQLPGMTATVYESFPVNDGATH